MEDSLIICYQENSISSLIYTKIMKAFLAVNNYSSMLTELTFLSTSNSYGYSPHFKQPSSRPPRNYYPSFSYATNYYIPKEPMRSTQAASFPRVSSQAAAAAAANAGHRRWQQQAAAAAAQHSGASGGHGGHSNAGHPAGMYFSPKND